jgi:hypothetical protein
VIGAWRLVIGAGGETGEGGRIGKVRGLGATLCHISCVGGGRVVLRTAAKYNCALKRYLIDNRCISATIGGCDAFSLITCSNFGVPMRGRKKTFSLHLTDSQRSELQRWQRTPTQLAGLVRRARLILLLDQGQSVTEAAQTAGLAPKNARKWIRRFLERGVAGLHDKPGRGRQPVFSPRGRAAPGQDGVRATG